MTYRSIGVETGGTRVWDWGPRPHSAIPGFVVGGWKSINRSSGGGGLNPNIHI